MILNLRMTHPDLKGSRGMQVLQVVPLIASPLHNLQMPGAGPQAAL